MPKSPPEYNLKKGGAIGDGKTNDTRAFQKLIDLAAEEEATIFIPPGRYCLSNIKVHPKVGIVGLPTFAWKDSAGSVLALIDPEADCLLDLSYSIGAHLRGLCLDGNFLEGNTHGILVNKSDYGNTEDSPVLENCKVSRFSGDGLRLNRIWCFRIRGCMFSENRGNGISMRGWDGFILDSWLSKNAGAGFATIGENNAVTITGNRIEWNESGGIIIRNGSHYNITGNYIDRCSPGLALSADKNHTADPTRIVGQVGFSTITGNIIYRSGKPEWILGREDASAHMILKNLRGVTVTGNTFVAGLDDENNPGSLGYGKVENWSPDCCLIVEKLRNVIVKDNAMDSAAIRELIVDRGDHGPGFIIKDNPGELFTKTN